MKIRSHSETFFPLFYWSSMLRNSSIIRFIDPESFITSPSASSITLPPNETFQLLCFLLVNNLFIYIINQSAHREKTLPAEGVDRWASGDITSPESHDLVKKKKLISRTLKILISATRKRRRHHWLCHRQLINQKANRLKMTSCRFVS